MKLWYHQRAQKRETGALHIYTNGFQLNNPHGIENSCAAVNALHEMLCMSAGNNSRLLMAFKKIGMQFFKTYRLGASFWVPQV